jgi:pilus assembly protein CpaB
MGLTFSHSALDRPAVILPMALLLLAAAGGVMWSNLIGRENIGTPPAPVSQATAVDVAVLVPASDIPRGAILSAQDVSLQRMSPAKAPPAALHRPDDVQGHIALASITAGTPILNSQISAQALSGLSAHVPQSYRAYSIPVSEADIAGGFVQAGDHVDLYVTLPGALFAQIPDGKADDRSKAALLLQAVRVLAVGGKLQGDGAATPAVRTVTLALSADDLAKVALAARLGTITFAIRNPADDAAQSAAHAELSNLVGPSLASDHDQVRAQIRKSPTGVPFYTGRERTNLSPP